MNNDPRTTAIQWCLENHIERTHQDVLEGGVNAYLGELLWALDRCKVPPKRILDLGLGHGISSLLWLSETDATIDCVDVLEAGAHRGGDLLREVNSPRWTFHLGKAAEIVPTLPGKFDFIFLDTSHDYEDSVDELPVCWAKLRKGGVLTGHDHVAKQKSGEWSMPGLRQALKEFQATIPDAPYEEFVDTNFGIFAFYK